MLQVSTKIQDGQLRQATAKEARRLAYDLTEALNDATKAIQLEWKRAIRRGTKVRREAFTMNQVKIAQFASVRKGVISSVLAIEPKPRSILAALDEGGDRPNLTKGGKPMAIPVTGTLARKTTETTATLLSRLQMKKVSKGEWKGAQRAFLIPGVGVFQRTGPGASRTRNGNSQSGDDLKLLWTLSTRAKIAKALHFEKIAEAEFGPQFARCLTAVLARRKS